MALVSRLRQFDLFLAISKAFFLVFAQAIVAPGARDAFKVEWRCLVRFGYWIAAGIALIIGPFFKIMVTR